MGKYTWDHFLITKDVITSQKWINFNDFIKFLKEHHTEKDTIQDIRRDNILKSFQKHGHGIRCIDKQQCWKSGKAASVKEYQITFVSFLRFCFNHYDQLEICKKIADEVESFATQDESVPSDSLFDFYTTVSKSSLRLDTLDKLLFETANEVKIPCLFQTYEQNFTQVEWEKIKVFEYHFWTNIQTQPQTEQFLFSSVSSVLERWKYFSHCQNVHALKPLLLFSIKESTKTNTKRKEAASKVTGVQLNARTSHLPNLVDETVTDLLEFHFPGSFQNVVCLDCTQNCSSNHKPGIHVYAEVKRGSPMINLEDTFILMKSELSSHHGEACVEVTIYEQDALKQYTKDGMVNQRFHLRDDISLGKLSSLEILAKSEHDMEIQEPLSACPTCFPVITHSDPLDFRTFDLIKEWKYYVPLPFQIILETFINPESLTSSNHPDKLAKEKIEKLHLLYDALMNVTNRKYMGLQQEVNTDQLSATYHNVSNVFTMTSKGGLTNSFTRASERLTQQADPDTCYYNTFIKKYQLDYEAQDGQTHLISLQDCHLIFCLDNLVRLCFHRDPDRGDSRSSQICTLPMTVMGIPKDAAVLDTWHDDEICNGTASCQCKERDILKNEDLRKVFHELSEKEELQWKKLNKNLTWGLTYLWKGILDSSLEQQVTTAVQKNQEAAPHVLENDEEPPEEWQDAYYEELDQVLEKLHQDEGLLDISLSDISPESSADVSMEEDDNVEMTTLNESLLMMTIGCSPLPDDEATHVPTAATEDKTLIEDVIASMGYTVFQPVNTLVRHPPPAIGRDDDIHKLREILDDILIKSGKSSDTCRILFAPDNKIARCLFRLMDEDQRFKRYLPEFPLLHLRKSKLGTLCSAYKDAGLYHLLRFMQDNEEDLKKILSGDNVEMATHNIRRLSYAFHMAVMIKFLDHLSADEAKHVFECLQDPKLTMETKFLSKLEKFIHDSSTANATFALHLDMLTHCDEILALSIAERIGGEDGYNLMLAAVKASLPFAFLNGASAYAVFCTRLLYEHYSAGKFHRCLKETFFTSPYRESSTNLGLDTQREMEHRDALKGFRPRATVTSVLPRMSLVDRFLEIESVRGEGKDKASNTTQSRTWSITRQDLNHIYPTVALILRQGGLNSDKDDVPKNVYTSRPSPLPETVLDSKTFDGGRFLIEQFVYDSKFHNSKDSSKPVLPSPTEVSKELIHKMKTLKSKTVRRMSCKTKTPLTQKEAKEVSRKKKSKVLINIAECLSSDMNTCQSVVRPDGSKSSVPKASGMKKALIQHLGKLLKADCGSTSISNEDVLQKAKLVYLGLKDLPKDLLIQVKVAIVEFAGHKFKTRAKSGQEYVRYFEETMKTMMTSLPNINHIIVCEEKYRFTPDAFKAATRMKRAKSNSIHSITHLKRGEEIISSDVFDKKAVTSTEEGKVLISSFLARNVENLNINKDLTLDIDSEWILEGCNCQNKTDCSCSTTFAVPTRSVFTKGGPVTQTKLEHIQQRKGEAEMSQLDWMMEVSPELKDAEAVLSSVSSGDIDSIPIHLFTVSNMWPRNEDRSFKHPVYVQLQKPGSIDVYNITAIIELLESHHGEDAALKLAMGLCIGGNDFLPKFYGVTHSKMLFSLTEDSPMFNNLFTFDKRNQHGAVSRANYQNLLKCLFCPKGLDADKLTFEEVRQLSIKSPRQKEFARPQTWLPPKTALEQICLLLEYQIDYLFTAGHHSTPHPDFLAKGCIRLNKDGDPEYYLGEDVHVLKQDDLLLIPESSLLKRIMDCKKKDRTEANKRSKRTLDDTPQKGARRKRQLTSTPRKN